MRNQFVLYIHHCLISFSMFVSDMCRDLEFACGSGFCVEATAQCDGFVDCVINREDEALCSMSNGHSKLYLTRAVHSSHQYFFDVTNKVIKFKSPFILVQFTKLCCIIQLRFKIWNVYHY